MDLLFICLKAHLGEDFVGQDVPVLLFVLGRVCLGEAVEVDHLWEIVVDDFCDQLTIAEVSGNVLLWSAEVERVYLRLGVRTIMKMDG